MNPPNSSQRARMKEAFQAAVLEEADQATRPVAPEVALRAGQVIGKCSIVRELGRGGMGAVYLAKHLTLEVPVAVKVLPPSIGKSADYAERFLREARLAATLRHPNVLAVMDADKDPATGLYYMVMEYVDGGSIGDRVARGPLAEKAAAQVVSGVAKALSAAEKQGIIHRDIKPANILVTKDGRVKLADLGLAKRAGQSDITQSSAALGTPYYMSPEQIQDSKRVDIRSDIYSLGATFFHMMTGRPPYPGNDVYNVLHAVMTAPVPNPKTSKPDLSDSNVAICMRMLEKDASKRYQSPSQVLDDLSKAAVPAGLELEPAAAGAPAPPTPLGLSGSGGSPALEQGRVVIDMSTEVRGPTHRTLQVAMALATLLIAFIAALLILKSGKENPGRTDGAAEVKSPEKVAEKPPEKPPADADASQPDIPKPAAVDAMPTDPAPAKPAPEKSLPLHEGAILALSFEEDGADGDKPLVKDGSGARSDGMLRGAAKRGEGRSGKGLSLDGGDAVLELPAIPVKSLAFWMKSDLPLQQGLLDAGGFQVGIYQIRGIYGGENESTAGLFVSIDGLDAVVPCDEIRSGWHHVVVAWDGGTEVRVAIDGKFPDGSAFGSLQAAVPSAAPQPLALPRKPVPVPAALLVGRTRTAWHGKKDTFRGTVDELAAWSRPLSPQEMEAVAVRELKGKGICAEIRAKAPKPPEDVAVEKPPADKPPADKPPVKPADGKKKPALSDGCLVALTFDPDDLRSDDASRKAGKGFIVDVTGHGNDAAKDRSTTFRTGRNGPPDQGIEFDGKGRASGDVTEGGVLTLPALDEKTVAFWFQCLEHKAGIIYDGGSVDRPDQAFLVGVHLAGSWDFWRQDSDGVSVGFWGNDVIVPFKQAFDGGWHLLAVSWDGETSVTVVIDGKVMSGQAYRGGVLTRFDKAATLSARPSPQNAGKTLVGTSRKSGHAPLAGFRGQLDELAVWERALSEEELTKLAAYAAKKKSYCEEIAGQVKEK